MHGAIFRRRAPLRIKDPPGDFAAGTRRAQRLSAAGSCLSSSQDATEVRLDCGARHEQCLRDLPVGAALGRQPSHPQLARRQRHPPAGGSGEVLRTFCEETGAGRVLARALQVSSFESAIMGWWGVCVECGWRSRMRPQECLSGGVAFG
jgi:hypothetical protein